MNKGFQFRLQPVLDWRKLQADQAQHVVSQHEALERDLYNQLETIRESILQASHSSGFGWDNPMWRTQLTVYIQSLRDKELDLLKKLRKQQQVTTHYRLQLKQNRIRERSLELLQDKQKQNWKDKTEKHEREELEEIAQQLSFRPSIVKSTNEYKHAPSN
jgi:flagellar export protein FliJ